MSSKTKWTMTLRKVDEMIAASNASLYDRVKLLCQVWDDQDFIAHHNGDVDAAEKHLNQKLGDYAIGFFEARSLLKHKPRRGDWEGGSIRQILAEALDAERQSRKQEAVDQPQRKGPVPRKEHEQVLQQLERVTERNEQQADEIGSLRAKIAELERENATLRGRVEQLEKMVGRAAA